MVLRNFHVGIPFNFLKIDPENATLEFLSVKCYTYTIITKARLWQFKENFIEGLLDLKKSGNSKKLTKVINTT